MNFNCPPPELPDMNRLCRMDFCQACDLFPVDMGIDVGPLQARINECKRRYHREVWKILCDGVDGIEDQEAGAKDGKSGAVKESDRSARGGAGKAKFAGAGRPGFGHLELDGDRRDGRAVRNQEDFEDILKDLDARTEDTTKKRENRNNKSRPPPRKLNNQSNSTDSPASSSRRRPRSRSVGGVPASGNATKAGMAWLPIQAELQKLRSSLAAAAALAATATAATKSRRRNNTRSDDFDDSKGNDGEKDIGELIEETTLTGESRSEPQRGQTLVVTLTLNSENRTVAACSSTASFRTDTATSSAPMRISSSAPTAGTALRPATALRSATTTTDSGTPTRSTTSNSKRQVRSEISFSSSKIRNNGSGALGRATKSAGAAATAVAGSKSETIKSSLNEQTSNEMRISEQ
ncbi:hypothetical protein BOX15_Mlig028124g1 [Macrostomum lignano]|uniref:Zf-CpG_bind_C domain-containing protein n=2 Tax=Macrostomum lignano TaxID=282301 RepID=A0A1I8HN22_9PLAT|nr:hypothetical protein BOX15_Mlig028124g1 [Macrostomum lignano]